MQTPTQIATDRMKMAQEYADKAKALSIIKMKKATEIVFLRAKPEVKSDTQAERLWATTPDGQQEIRLSFELKALEKLISAAKTMQEALNGEVRNYY